MSPFGTKNIRNAQFSVFLLHALTYCPGILHMTLFYCTTYQVRVSSICINFWRRYARLGTQNTGTTQFSALFSYMLWHIGLRFYIWLYFFDFQVKWLSLLGFKFEGVMPLWMYSFTCLHSLLCLLCDWVEDFNLTVFLYIIL